MKINCIRRAAISRDFAVLQFLTLAGNKELRVILSLPLRGKNKTLFSVEYYLV